MNKNTSLFPLLLALALLLGACGAPAGPTAEPAPLAVAAAVADSQDGLPPMAALTPADDGFAAYLSGYYGLAPEAVADGAICYAGGLEAGEIAVLRLTDEAAARTAQAALADYTDRRAAGFAGYVPAQAQLASSGLALASGTWAVLFICPAPEAAQAAFDACFDPGWTPPDTAAVFAPAAASPTPTAPPPADAGDIFDAQAVLTAWQTGGRGTLTGKNLAVYDACVQVIGACITPEMSDYDRELAIHDFLTGWAQYDPEAQSHGADAAPDPDNGNPYGLLIRQVAICRGYASSFQLFMDLLGIECITVPGTSNSGQEEHAWNMVRLDGAWYCVDVTWDDPTGGTPGHRFFNVTSQFLRDTDHQWDEDAVPEATATAWAWVAD